MAAQAWSFFNKFKEYMADGTIDLDTQTFYLHYLKSAYTFAATHSILGDLSSEVTNGNGYATSGLPLTVTWAQGASASEMRFDFTDEVMSATGIISALKAAVIVAGTGASAKTTANKLVMFASLTSSQFNLASGNSLTLQTPANGAFELN